ncbi:interleukin-3 receptor subunit alpha isoform X3 [Orcinus orca]|uniref:interleukin-3 receptor subunit alpha isoform X3 n=1 Tax=Orcinus orca TaxID=9733 RepID=UPI0021124119|nr:interleukin-3 receptor subunit alpha isoform X3 [Orcinus orca]
MYTDGFTIKIRTWQVSPSLGWPPAGSRADLCTGGTGTLWEGWCPPSCGSCLGHGFRLAGGLPGARLRPAATGPRRESQGGCRKPDLLGSRRGFPDVQLGGGPGGPEGRAVPSLPGEPGDQTRFLVNGTGSGSKIPCSETSDRLAKIEVLAAPNITSRWCNQSYSFMQWQVRSHLNDDFKYELQIQKGTELAYKQEIYKAFLELNNPGTYTVQVRARDATFSHYKPWGPWSVPQHFVCEEGARLPVWLTSLLIALGTLLAMGLVLRFCRFSVMQKLFPPIPHMKDHINGKLQNGRTMTWDPDQDSQEECPVAEVQVLGET